MVRQLFGKVKWLALPRRRGCSTPTHPPAPPARQHNMLPCHGFTFIFTLSLLFTTPSCRTPWHHLHWSAVVSQLGLHAKVPKAASVPGVHGSSSPTAALTRKRVTAVAKQLLLSDT